MHAHGGFFVAERAAAVFTKGNPRAYHLPFARFTAQMDSQLVNLTQAARADRMPPAFETTAGVDGNFTANLCRSAFSEYSPFTAGAESEPG